MNRNEKRGILTLSGRQIRSDDLVLIGIIWMLLQREKRDMILIIALAFLFLCEYVDFSSLLEKL